MFAATPPTDCPGFCPEDVLSAGAGGETRLAVAVSGGVDSLCALVLARRAGFEVTAVHARLWEPDGHPDEETVARLEDVCARLGARFYLADLREPFRRAVVEPFARAYARGLTPNPCVLCNRAVKFGLFLETAEKLGCPLLATGHYAALDRHHPYRGKAPLLTAAKDQGKDQSYFLSLVERRALARVVFPLADLEKRTVRALVAEAGLEVPQPTESQEICFVPENPGGAGYRDFLRKLLGDALSEDGPVIEVDSGREIGRHGGLWRYTEGQRRGLGIAWTEPLYVIAKDVEANVLRVGNRGHVKVSRALVDDVNFMVGEDELPPVVLARLRYRQKPVPAHTEVTEDGGLVLAFERELDLSAPGQTACVQDAEGRVLAAGRIAELA